MSDSSKPAAKKKIRLMIADVDGTLVTQQKFLTPRAIGAVKKLGDVGIAFTITSGRPPRGMLSIVQTLGMTLPLAGFNGGAFVNADMSPIEGRLIGEGVAKQIVDSILSQNLDVWVYCDQGWYLRDPHAPHVNREQSTVNFAPKVVASLDDVLHKVVKIVVVSDDLPLVERVEGDLQKKFAGMVSAVRSQPYYLDVTNPLANKGEVVKWFSRRMNIGTEEICTIGDMPTDVNMFTISGMSIAMGNASAAVQAKATYVTDSNENEGFAKGVEKYLLGV